MKRTIALLFAATVLLAACGSDSEGSGSSSSGSTSSASEEAFNDADVAFAQGMIPHHQQAVEMADMALEKGSSSEVKALAEEIKAAQDPEIETMRGWLEAWGEDEAAEADDMGGDMDHNSGSADAGTEGMMSEDDMNGLDEASGAEFDTMFLEMMIEHHTGAIAMAETEQAEGESAEAIELAGQIIEAQEAEIAEMEALLEAEA